MSIVTATQALVRPARRLALTSAILAALATGVVLLVLALTTWSGSSSTSVAPVRVLPATGQYPGVGVPRAAIVESTPAHYASPNAILGSQSASSTQSSSTLTPQTPGQRP